jgi:hypothetical protein
MRNILALILFFSSLLCSAQTVDINTNAKKGIDAVIELRSQDLQKILAQERKVNPDNRVSDYLEAAALSIRIFLVEDEAYHQSKSERLDFLVNRLEALPDSEPYKRVFLAEVSLARAGIYAKFKSNIKAAWLFYRAYNLLEDNYKEYPQFAPTLIPLGVLQTAVGSLPEDYKSMASIFGFDGNIELGLKLIRQAYYYSIADPKLKFHQGYFGFVYAYVNFELATEEQVSLSTLDMNVKGSSFFSYLEAQQLLANGQTAMALQLMEDRPMGDAYLEVPFFDYYTGKVALMIKPEKAESYLLSFLQSSRDNENRKSTYRYLAWYHLLKSEGDKAEMYRQKILFEPTDILSGPDKQAIAEAKRGFNIFLIRARLDFDAGRYTKIIKDLDPKKVSKIGDEDWVYQEFYYRRSRAFQELGFKDKALAGFLKSSTWEEHETYSLGNSLLQIALLYEEKSNFKESRRYFLKALSLKSYAFHEGVHQKARAGLERMP